jgi:DNA-binding MarR family transcriptional regulator
MSNWPLSEVRMKIAELAHCGVGGTKLLEVLARGSLCAPTECDQLDFKRQVNEDEIGLAETCRDVAAFYNMYGGYIVVGIEEHGNETFEVIGAAAGFDVERIKNKLKDFTGERVLVTQEACTWAVSPNNLVQVFVLNIPARRSEDHPIAFLKDGPGKGSKGKRIFEKGEIPIREGDETTTARGAKVVEIWESRPHPLLSKSEGRSTTPLARVSHNLPDRNIICPQVMGRKDALEHLWRWLPDDLSHVKVLAGEGGIGKSSVAYEFADQVSLLSRQTFQQVVWLSAKQRQFRPLTNSYDEMAETHFGTYDELLDRICDFLAITDGERADSSRQKKLRLIKRGFEIMPSLVVVDDIDSLEDIEQRQALELGFLLSGTNTKLLLTTRNNIIYSGDVCYTVRGIEKEEFPGFFEALMTRFPSPTRLSPKPTEVDRIWDASKGSPLFAESILRLLAYQNVGEAIGHWKGEAGDDVRKAALHREIKQLSPEARRILLTLALLSEASLAELAEVTGYDSARVAAAIQNLSSLFLVEAPRLGSENRIRVSETTGRLVLSIRRELAADHVRLEKAIRDFRATAPEGQKRAANKLVGAAILQASALERQGKITEALETLSHAARKTAKGKRGDLLAYVGYLHSRKTPPEFELSRRSCREAFNEECFKPRLFETWFSAEWELGNFPGTEEVARAALDKSIEPIYEWRIRLAAALSSKAHAQGGGRISVSVLPAYLEASRELSEAIRLAPSDEAHKWRSNLEDANDSIYRASLEAVAAPSDRLTVIRHLMTFVRQGDWRIRNYARILGLVEELLTIAGRTVNTHSGHVAATRSSFEEVRHLLRQRVERFPNDERHEALRMRCELLSAQLVRPSLPERPHHVTPPELEKGEQIAEMPSALRQEQSLDGVRVSSTNVEIRRPPLPDHLSTDKGSPHYVYECFKFQVGIRLNGKERFDVKEYCLSQGWVMVPAGKTLDRRGNPLLVKLKGTVESFYKDI